jgi:hypothetical protein
MAGAAAASLERLDVAFAGEGFVRLLSAVVPDPTGIERRATEQSRGPYSQRKGLLFVISSIH